MWWPRKPAVGRRAGAARWAAVGVACVAAAGCGYQPLYRQAPVNGSTVESSLASVTVDRIPDRTGQELRNALEQALGSALANGGGARSGRYHLRISLTDTSVDVALRRLDASVSRSDMQVTATWWLLEDDRVIRQGSAQAVLNYAVQTNQYPTIASIKNAESQGAQLVADDIVRQLQAYFSGLPPTTERPAVAPPPAPIKPSP